MLCELVAQWFDPVELDVVENLHDIEVVDNVIHNAAAQQHLGKHAPSDEALRGLLRLGQESRRPLFAGSTLVYVPRGASGLVCLDLQQLLVHLRELLRDLLFIAAVDVREVWVQHGDEVLAAQCVAFRHELVLELRQVVVVQMHQQAVQSPLPAPALQTIAVDAIIRVARVDAGAKVPRLRTVTPATRRDTRVVSAVVHLWQRGVRGGLVQQRLHGDSMGLVLLEYAVEARPCIPQNAVDLPPRLLRYGGCQGRLLGL
mmetsp:Transcript_91872/g.259501  ORF Transcript_91872/g.259501 Transcript_91872/m.259501 type:complete len:258 (-) Transcript_91872:243-1016(-)